MKIAKRTKFLFAGALLCVTGGAFADNHMQPGLHDEPRGPSLTSVPAHHLEHKVPVKVVEKVIVRPAPHVPRHSPRYAYRAHEHSRHHKKVAFITTVR